MGKNQNATSGTPEAKPKATTDEQKVADIQESEKKVTSDPVVEPEAEVKPLEQPVEETQVAKPEAIPAPELIMAEDLKSSEPEEPKAEEPQAPAQEQKPAAKESVFSATPEIRFKEKDVELPDGATRRQFVLQQRFEHSDPEKNGKWVDVPVIPFED